MIAEANVQVFDILEISHKTLDKSLVVLLTSSIIILITATGNILESDGSDTFGEDWIPDEDAFEFFTSEIDPSKEYTPAAGPKLT